MSINSSIFFESILYLKGQFPFLHLHLERIEKLALYLNTDFSTSISEFEKILRKSIIGTSEQKLKIKFAITETQLIITAIESYSTKPYSFQNNPPISLVIFPNYRKPLDGNSLWKYEDAAIYHHSIKYALENGASQSILLNQYGDIIETSLSNFFYIINGITYTPPQNSGAVNGVFRRFLMSKMEIKERILNVQELPQIQECFITNAIRGMVSVAKINDQDFPTAQFDQLKKGLSDELENIM